VKNSAVERINWMGGMAAVLNISLRHLKRDLGSRLLEQGSWEEMNDRFNRLVKRYADMAEVDLGDACVSLTVSYRSGGWIEAEYMSEHHHIGSWKVGHVRVGQQPSPQEVGNPTS
jgi:hypothetical protein